MRTGSYYAKLVVVTTIVMIFNPFMEYHLEESLGFALHRTYMRTKAASARRLRPHGLTPDQFGVLAVLWDEPGLSQGEIARLLVKDAPNITRIVDRLQAKKLVERRNDPHDRRTHRIYPSKQGLALKKTLTPEVLNMRSELFGALSPKEQASMRKLLDKLFESLE
jgi:DNA-binding MarR family transcriptional regulator